MKNDNRFSTRLLITVLAISLILVFNLSGCGDQAEEPIEPEPTVVEYSIADLAELAGPSIAYIEASDDFYGDYYWFGSGFVVSENGVIVTNYHVLDGATSVLIEINGQVYEDIQVLAYNENWDLAVLKVDASGLTPLVLAGSVEDARLGEQVIAMGNPEGLKKTVSDGIISTLYRRLEDFDYDHIQTTAPISKGSSGGPLMNMRGEVIGVNTLTYMTGQNLNFAVPIDMVHNMLANQGQPMGIAEVFGHGSAQQTVAYFEHRPGELAVVLSWEGDADLDLEIWTDDFEFLEAASFLGDSPDITRGEQGEEWFAFTEYNYIDQGTSQDYGQGRYIVSVYYYGPEPAEGHGAVEARLDVYYPDGGSETFFVEEMWYTPPYDQWFALLVDADANEVKILDLYLDAPLVAMLEWDSEADLDLVVFSEKYTPLFTPYDFWYGYDITNGSLGLETFRFGVFSNDEGSFDFSEGLHDLLVYMENTGAPVTTATVTLLTPDLLYSRFSHTFTPDPRGDYLWLVAYDLDPQTELFYETDDSNNKVYLDE